MNKIKKKVVVTINSTQNNTILLAKNNLGRIIANSSIGLVLKKKRGKKSVANGAQSVSYTHLTLPTT